MKLKRKEANNDMSFTMVNNDGDRYVIINGEHFNIVCLPYKKAREIFDMDVKNNTYTTTDSVYEILGRIMREDDKLTLQRGDEIFSNYKKIMEG